ncbi:acetyl-CoA carboxylase, carboxyltransferase subunit beta [Iodidimonas sp. SYSU 1G8]|uniref:acetyl-CoA carboxylase, carboxyltransferase subunit beta n=1 Tax=Iodidimonas sp. SYSU 1G8 TaxID=3133967 RepID=UPI0031FF02B3
MNWLKKVRPKLSTIFRRERPTSEEAKWDTCVNCGQMIYHKEMVAAQYVCPHCGHHHKMPPLERLGALFDGGAYSQITVPKQTDDPLKFRDKKKYIDRIKATRTETGQQDAVIAAEGKIGGIPSVIAVQSFSFMGGSLGVGAGDAFVAGALHAVREKAAFIIVTSSGGARMQEGILSLMQMPRTTVAIQMLREARLPYIVVLTDPTTGGVTASYAMLGDIQISEPGALIGFAGPRVIESTVREQLPKGFQRAEYLLEHGMIDMIVHRHELADKLAAVLRLLMDGARDDRPLALAPPAKARRGAAAT